MSRRLAPHDGIEFVAPRTDAFGSEGSAEFVGIEGFEDEVFDHEPPHSPWITGLAALAVVGLLAAGILAAAPWDGEATSPPPTTQAAVATTTEDAGAAGLVVADDRPPPLSPHGEPGWLPADDRVGFRVDGATSAIDAGADGDPFAMWVAEGATRTSGRWLAIDAIPTNYAELRRDATILDVAHPGGTWPALLTTSDDGVVELIVTDTEPLVPFVLSGFGWSLDELLRIAAGVQVDRASVSVDDGLITDGGLLAGLVVAHDGMSPWNLGNTLTGQGRVFTWLSSQRTGARATVVVSPITVPATLIAQFLVRVPIPDTALRRAERVVITDLSRAGRPVSLFRDAHDPSLIGAAWFDGRGNEVLVTSNGRIGDLLDLVAALEPATKAAWGAAIATEPAWAGGSDPTVQVGGSIGEGWSLQVSSKSMWISGGDGWLSTAYPPTEGRAAIRYANPDDAYVVLVDATRGDADGRIAETAVVRQGTDGQKVALVPVNDGTRVAVVRVDPRSPFEVIWLAADGAELSGS